MGSDFSEQRLDLLVGLFALRFPELRAFQFRNAVVYDTMLPAGVYLLDQSGNIGREPADPVQRIVRDRLGLSCLEFMEAHQNLRMLAWPMQAFLSDRKSHPDIIPRRQAVINNLGRTLIDLRVDSSYRYDGEHQTEDFYYDGREDRRRFVSDFAAHMNKLESIKIEGGVPRDERRETIRALRRCPLKKIVFIGICIPLGNTWGENGCDVPEEYHDQDIPVDRPLLEAEHKEAIHRLGYSPPEPAPNNAEDFQPMYGWPAGPPMAHIIASYHAETITELKFCGYRGAPVLFDPTAITTPMLSGLKYFYKLEQLILSLYLPTQFEDELRDSEIIEYWLNSRSSFSTALVRVATSGEEESGGWEKQLKTRYDQDALSAQIVRQIGPFLSEKAKDRPGGVKVRASFCLGMWGGIFDLDMTIGKFEGQDVCLTSVGPREELEPQRRREKLESRQWF